MANQALIDLANDLPRRHEERKWFFNKYGYFRPDHYWDNPHGYIKFHLRIKLWSRTEEVVTKMMTPPWKTLVRSGHGTGKSNLFSCLASWHYDSWPESITVITSATSKNIKDVIFRELRLRRRGDPHMAPRNAVLRESAEHWIEGYTAESGEAYSGRHHQHMMFLFDESTDIAPEFWKSTYGMFIPNGNMYWVAGCNPIDPSSQFAIEEFSGSWHIVEISQIEHPNVQSQLRGGPVIIPGATELGQVMDILDTNSERIPEHVPPTDDEIRLEWADGRTIRWYSSPEADIRVGGKWAGTTSANVWSSRLFDRMLKVRHQHNPLYAIKIGADLAAFGDDNSVIAVMWGARLILLEHHNGWGPRQLRDRLKAIADHYAQLAGRNNEFVRGDPKRIPIYLDAGGDRHLAVTEYHDGYNFIGVNPAEKAINDGQYTNRRSELWFWGVKMAHDGAIDISALPEADQQALKLELTSPKYSLDNRMRKVVEEKKVTKKRLKRSPDRADALNLVLWGWMN